MTVLIDPGVEKLLELARARRAASDTPRGWRIVGRSMDGEAWVRSSGQTLIWSVAREDDGRVWLHLSTAYPDHLPRWAELVAVKEWIAGVDRPAYQVIPPRSTYVNLNDYVLHLWTPLEGDPPLPEFSAVVDGTRTI